MTDPSDVNDGNDIESLGQLHPALRWAAQTISQRYNSSLDVAVKLLLSSLTDVISDIIIGGNPISPMPAYILDTVRISNRVVSFLLDGTTHFGTGILVGPAHVLTAAHLFFDEVGDLIDPSRTGRTTVAVDTTLLGDIMLKTQRTMIPLLEAPHCHVDPEVIGISAQREVEKLDFAIVKLSKSIGNDGVGSNEQRSWFDIPTVETAPILAPDLPLRVFQFVDAKELRVSTGVFREFTSDGFRVAHTASTVDGSSGSFALNDRVQLLAMHVSGPLSGEVPRCNYALPVSRVAESIDLPGADGKTVRSKLQA